MFSLFGLIGVSVLIMNGSFFQGRITEYEAGIYVIIFLNDGTEKIINWDSIESIERKIGTKDGGDVRFDADSVMKLETKEQLKLTYDKTLPSDRLRVYWQSQGGNRFYNDINFTYVNTKMDFTYGSGEENETKMKLEGHGIGGTGSVSWLYFYPPDYTAKRFYSLASKVGLAYAVNTNLFLFDSENEFNIGENIYHIYTDYSILTTNFSFGATLGLNLGLGAFPVSQKWYGVIAGVNWRPVFRLSTTLITSAMTSDSPYIQDSSSSTSDTDNQFDFGTIEYSLDIGSIKALTDKFSPRAALRLSFLYVPPIGDTNMTMWMVGIGIGRYR
jgi:hypothetical protein